MVTNLTLVRLEVTEIEESGMHPSIRVWNVFTISDPQSQTPHLRPPILDPPSQTPHLRPPILGPPSQTPISGPPSQTPISAPPPPFRLPVSYIETLS